MMAREIVLAAAEYLASREIGLGSCIILHLTALKYDFPGAHLLARQYNDFFHGFDGDSRPFDYLPRTYDGGPNSCPQEVIDIRILMLLTFAESLK